MPKKKPTIKTNPKPKTKNNDSDKSWRASTVCHQCKEKMNYDVGTRVPVVGMPGVNWIVCSRKCAVALAEETGIRIGDKT